MNGFGEWIDKQGYVYDEVSQVWINMSNNCPVPLMSTTALYFLWIEELKDLTD